jgi:hypothetical protein
MNLLDAIKLGLAIEWKNENGYRAWFNKGSDPNTFSTMDWTIVATDSGDEHPEWWTHDPVASGAVAEQAGYVWTPQVVDTQPPAVSETERIWNLVVSSARGT